MELKLKLTFDTTEIENRKDLDENTEFKVEISHINRTVLKAKIIPIKN